MQKPVFVMNPRSRSGKTRKNLERYKQSIKESFENAEILLTERRRHAQELAQHALTHGADLVVAVGGDGTANEVLNGFFNEDGTLVNNNAHFATIMCGTGCDFRRTIDFPIDFEGQVQRIKEGKSRVIDVGLVCATTCEGKQRRYFLNESSAGLSAQVAKLVWEKKGRRNKFAYFFKGLLSLRDHSPTTLSLKTDVGEKIISDVSFIAFVNGSYFGGGMHVAPHASLQDGLGDVVCISNIGFFMAIRNVLKIYRGTHLSIPEVTHFKTQRLELMQPDANDVLVEMDGEAFGALPATFEILPSKLKLIC